MVFGEAIGDGFEAELREGCEEGLDVRVEEKTAVVVIGVEEGDVEIGGEAEKLG